MPPHAQRPAGADIHQDVEPNQRGARTNRKVFEMREVPFLLLMVFAVLLLQFDKLAELEGDGCHGTTIVEKNKERYDHETE